MTEATIHLKGSPAVIKIHLTDDVAKDAAVLLGRHMVLGGVCKLETKSGNKLIINGHEIACVIFDWDGGAQ